MMTKTRFKRSLLVAAIAAILFLSPNPGAAAIPCNELEVIPAPPDMVIPMIYFELPQELEDVLGRGQPVDREGSKPLEKSIVVGAAENQFLCLGYGQSDVFIGNSTPQHRVQMLGAVDPELGTEYITGDVYLVQLGEPIELADGRYLIDYAATVDDERYLIGELIFVEQDGTLYQDGAAVLDSADLNEEAITFEMSTRFTREVKRIDAVEGDRIEFENTELEEFAEISIANADGDVIFEGHAGPDGMSGGGPQNVFVIHDLEPGEYTANITFRPSDISYNVIIVIGD